MSRPVPSPSMKGMIGLSGTLSAPSTIVIFAPSAGTGKPLNEVMTVPPHKCGYVLGIDEFNNGRLYCQQRRTTNDVRIMCRQRRAILPSPAAARIAYAIALATGYPLIALIGRLCAAASGSVA